MGGLGPGAGAVAARTVHASMAAATVPSPLPASRKHCESSSRSRTESGRSPVAVWRSEMACSTRPVRRRSAASGMAAGACTATSCPKKSTPRESLCGNGGGNGGGGLSARRGGGQREAGAPGGCPPGGKASERGANAARAARRAWWARKWERRVSRITSSASLRSKRRFLASEAVSMRPMRMGSMPSI